MPTALDVEHLRQVPMNPLPVANIVPASTREVDSTPEPSQFMTPADATSFAGIVEAARQTQENQAALAKQVAQEREQLKARREQAIVLEQSGIGKIKQAQHGNSVFGILGNLVTGKPGRIFRNITGMTAAQGEKELLAGTLLEQRVQLDAQDAAERFQAASIAGDVFSQALQLRELGLGEQERARVFTNEVVANLSIETIDKLIEQSQASNGNVIVDGRVLTTPVLLAARSKAVSLMVARRSAILANEKGEMDLRDEHMKRTLLLLSNQEFSAVIADGNLDGIPVTPSVIEAVQAERAKRGIQLVSRTPEGQAFAENALGVVDVSLAEGQSFIEGINELTGSTAAAEPLVSRNEELRLVRAGIQVTENITPDDIRRVADMAANIRADRDTIARTEVARFIDSKNSPEAFEFLVNRVTGLQPTGKQAAAFLVFASNDPGRGINSPTSPKLEFGRGVLDRIRSEIETARAKTRDSNIGLITGSSKNKGAALFGLTAKNADSTQQQIDAINAEAFAKTMPSASEGFVQRFFTGQFVDLSAASTNNTPSHPFQQIPQATLTHLDALATAAAQPDPNGPSDSSKYLASFEQGLAALQDPSGQFDTALDSFLDFVASPIFAEKFNEAKQAVASSSPAESAFVNIANDEIDKATIAFVRDVGIFGMDLRAQIDSRIKSRFYKGGAPALTQAITGFAVTNNVITAEEAQLLVKAVKEKTLAFAPGVFGGTTTGPGPGAAAISILTAGNFDDPATERARKKLAPRVESFADIAIASQQSLFAILREGKK